jgi:thymidylate synthase
VRVYTDFIQAKNEIRRDLNELGTTVFAGYQGMDHSKLDREKFTTKELHNYGYVVTRPFISQLQPIQPWADAEWEERLSGARGNPVNPGEAWKLRPEVWTPLLEKFHEMDDGAFSYTYSERFAESVPPAIFELFTHPTSRQAYVSVWNPALDGPNVGHRRVPCTLGYHFMLRNGELHTTYYMRSSDFGTHFDNDVYLAMKLAYFVAECIDQPVGSFTHVINSLHVYAADVAGVF